MSLVDLISKLEIYTNSDSHKQVYDTGLVVLKKDPTSVKALKQCLVALINLDNYSTALQLLNSHEKLANDPSLLLEKAYVYYKLNDAEQLQKLNSQGATSSNIGFLHILAQHYYRIGKSEEALELYQQLVSESKIKSEELDISVNERAVISQLKFHSQNGSSVVPVSKGNFSSYDLIFNEALIKIREHQFEEALKLLNEAHQKASAQLSDSDEDEKVSELTPIKIQIAYVNQLLNRPDESAAVLSNLASLKDQIFKLLITNNLLSLKNTKDLNSTLLYRHLNFPDSLSSKILDRLTLPQIKTLQRNEILLAYKSGKTVKKSAKSHNKLFPGSCLPLALSTLSQIGDQNVFKYSVANPADLPINLLAVQLSIDEGNLNNASIILENLVKFNEDNLKIPSIARLLITAYDSLDRKNAKVELLNQIYSLLINQTDVDLKYYKFIGFELLSFDEEKANNIFLKLSKFNDELVSTILNKDSTTILTPVDELIQDVNIDELISKDIQPLLSAKIKKSTTASSKVTKKQVKKLRPKKKRLPKDLTSKIDKERWIPLKDRSYYRQKKSKKNVKDTQGGAIDAATEQSLNISAKESTPAPTSHASHTSSSKNKKKNKKKGRK